METLKGCVAGTTQKESQVEGEMRAMGVAVSRGEELLLGLKDRLKTILNDTPPTPTCEEQGIPNLVPLAHNIRLFRKEVEGNNRLVEDILERLEL